MSVCRIFGRISFLTAALVLASCSSTKFVKVTVDPPEAVIYMNDVKVGTGTYESILDFGKTPTITFVAKLEKFADGKVDVTFEPETETEFSLKLKRLYSVTVPLVDFVAEKKRAGMKLSLQTTDTIAYYEQSEPSAETKKLTLVTDNDKVEVFYGGPVLSPVSDHVFYRLLKKNENGSLCEILRQKVGTNSTTKLVSESRANSLFPSLTPDGSGYIYCSDRINGKYALWLRKFKGTARSRLSKGLNQDFSSAVSPNGSKVVFTSLPAEGEELEVWTLDVNSGLPSQLGAGYDPQVSPDGKTIMFLLDDPVTKRSQIWTMDFEGGERTQLTSSDSHDIKDPRWSPDGKVIVYASNEGKDDKGRQNFDIWMMNTDGSGLKQLTSNGSHDDKPCFDRHGEQVYFRSNRGTKWNIWSIKLGERYSNKNSSFDIK